MLAMSRYGCPAGWTTKRMASPGCTASPELNQRTRSPRLTRSWRDVPGGISCVFLLERLHEVMKCVEAVDDGPTRDLERGGDLAVRHSIRIVQPGDDAQFRRGAMKQPSEEVSVRQLTFEDLGR